MDLNWIANELKDIDQARLPGRSAQFKMAPEGRREREAKTFRPDNYRNASVLILLYEDDKGLHFPLIQRHQYEGSHSGQVSLPGGKPEKIDDDLYGTALREANEEIGIDPEQTEFICALTPLFIPPSGFLVSPFVSVYRTKPQFTLEEREVKELLLTPLPFLFDPEHIRTTSIPLGNGMRIKTPYYHWHNRTVWGATAMILSEFRELIEQKKPFGS